VTHLIVESAAAASSGELSGLTSSVLALLSKIGSVLLIVFIGYKALGHIARDQFGEAVGLIVIARPFGPCSCWIPRGRAGCFRQRSRR
jgi:hypothetical protein